MVRPILVAAFLLILAAGCLPNAANSCAGGTLGAVAADAETPSINYVALTASGDGDYAIVQASSLANVWKAIADDTALAMLAPASGGVIVVNGGAAARRLDASGGLLWTIGYGDLIGAEAALTDGDRLVLADAQSARLYGPDGVLVWDHALPAATTGISQVVADRKGGSWLVGTFAGSFAPWAVGSTTSTSKPSGPFLLHLDGSGDEIGGGAWDMPGITFNQAVEGVDAGGLPMLVVWAATHGVPAPAFGVAMPQGDVLFTAGFATTGGILWSQHTLAAVTNLQVDPDGNVLALTQAAGALLIDRWDATGTVTVGTNFQVDAMKTAGLSWVAAPSPDGIVVAGEQIVPDNSDEDSFCVGQHFLLQIDTADLTVEPLPSRLP